MFLTRPLGRRFHSEHSSTWVPRLSIVARGGLEPPVFAAWVAGLQPAGIAAIRPRQRKVEGSNLRDCCRPRVSNPAPYRSGNLPDSPFHPKGESRVCQSARFGKMAPVGIEPTTIQRILSTPALPSLPTGPYPRRDSNSQNLDPKSSAYANSTTGVYGGRGDRTLKAFARRFSGPLPSPAVGLPLLSSTTES